MVDAKVHWGSEPVDPYERSLPGVKTRFLLERVPERGRVIELGCGEGKILRTLAIYRPELELHGSDVRETLKGHETFTFHPISENRVPLPTGSLDVVLIVDVLEHVPDPGSLLAEAARLLRPGGRLIGIIPVEGEKLSFYALYRAILGRDVYALTKEHIQTFTHDSLDDLLRRHFEVTDVRYAYHALGQLMDASFFAAAQLRKVREFWWNENAYYNVGQATGPVGRAINTLLKVGNAMAWMESTKLSRVRTGACAVMVEATVRTPPPL